MNSQNHSTRQSADDRAALREELTGDEENSERLAVFDKLNEEAADAVEAETPPMPDALRDRLVEQFGDAEPVRTPKPAPVAGPGIFERIAEFFREKPLAFGGTALAAAAAVMVLFVAIRPDIEQTSRLRGGDGTSDTAVGEGVAVYIVTTGSAETILGALENRDAAKVVANASELPASGSAVALDLDNNRLRILKDGKAVVERTVTGEPGEVALELRAAIDEATSERE